MGKPVIVLADADEEYLRFLEQCFLREYGEQIEIHTITDPQFFGGYFREPHRTDVMIAGEGFYHPRLLQYRFPCVLALADRREQVGVDANGVLHVCKYMDAEAASRQLLQVSHPVLDAAIAQGGWTKLISVYSAVGGCGKTALAQGLCAALASAGKRVLYVDAERLNHFQDHLQNAIPLPAEVCQQFTLKDSYQRLRGQLRREEFTYLPPLPGNLMQLKLDFSVYSGFIESARRSGDFDFIIADMDTVFDNHKGYLLSISSDILLLSDWTAASLRATERIYGNMDPWMREKVTGIVNNSRADANLALAASALAYPVQEWIPYLEDMSERTPAEWAGQPEIRRLTRLFIGA